MIDVSFIQRLIDLASRLSELSGFDVSVQTTGYPEELLIWDDPYTADCGCDIRPFVLDADKESAGALVMSKSGAHIWVTVKQQPTSAVLPLEDLVKRSTSLFQVIAEYVSSLHYFEQLKTALDSMETGVLAINNEGTILFMNKYLEHVFGTPSSATAMRSIHDVFPTAPMREVLTTRQGYKDQKIMVTTPEGRRTYRASAMPLLLEQTFVGVLGILEDLKRGDAPYGQAYVTCRHVSFDDIISVSETMAKVKTLAATVADGPSSVLILGETGTGKDLLARAIHSAGSRRDMPFVPVNCGGIPDTLLESELFGFEDGAFTGAKRGGKPGKFELSHRGTLFLDEIGDMPIHLQNRLLRVLEDGVVDRLGSVRPRQVDTRIICATGKNLDQMVGSGQFRADLYFRISVIPIKLPPLRERPEDIPVLATHFLKQCNTVLGADVKSISPEALTALLTYHWPGNVRQLANAVEFAVNVAGTGELKKEHLPLYLSQDNASDIRLQEMVDSNERNMLKAVLSYGESNNYTKAQLAAMIGTSRMTLYRKLKKHDLG